jgi:hypothetical protein
MPRRRVNSASSKTYTHYYYYYAAGGAVAAAVVAGGLYVAAAPRPPAQKIGTEPRVSHDVNPASIMGEGRTPSSHSAYDSIEDENLETATPLGDMKIVEDSLQPAMAVPVSTDISAANTTTTTTITTTTTVKPTSTNESKDAKERRVKEKGGSKGNASTYWDQNQGPLISEWRTIMGNVCKENNGTAQEQIQWERALQQEGRLKRLPSIPKASEKPSTKDAATQFLKTKANQLYSLAKRRWE